MDYCGPRGIALSDFLRWDRRSQDAALEWTNYEARRCHGCGTHPADWAEDPRAYHAHLSDQCPGCLASARLSERAKDLDPGVRIVVPLGHAADCPKCSPR